MIEKNFPSFTPSRLHVDHENSAGLLSKFNNFSAHIESELMSQSNELIQLYQLNANSWFLALFMVLISRYTGDDTVGIGITSPCPSIASLDWMPLCCHIDSTDSLVAFTQGCHRMVKDMSSKDRGLGVRSREEAAIPIIFSYVENYKLQVSNAQRYFGFDLYFEIRSLIDNCVIYTHYHERLYLEDTIKCFVEKYQELLRKVTEDPEQPIGKIDILSMQERTLILNTWNNTTVDYSIEYCLHQLIEKKAEESPNCPAVTFGDHKLTYAELNQKANVLARLLLERTSLGSGDFVAICMERSLDLVLGIVAILKTGAAYLPLDPDFPKERLLFMLDDSKAKIFFTSDNIGKRLSLTNDKKTLIAPKMNIEISLESNNLNCEVKPDDNAYCIYTSGSTGKPKGVLIRHRSICNYLQWMVNKYGYSKDDRFLQISTCSFDASVWEFFAPLVSGGNLAVAPPGLQKNFLGLIEYIKEQNVTVLQVVPSQLNILVDVPEFVQCASLRLVFSGGEALTRTTVRKFHNLLSADLHNLYGPTEVTIDATAYHCRREDEYNREIIPIGFPLDNTKLYVLDQHGNPVPIGVPGELYVGGIQVAAGYLSRPELTLERFVPDPFSDCPDDRLYRTGDLCSWRPDGCLLFIRRIDEQLKIRGFRIEPGEVEVAILEHSDIHQAIVIVQDVKANDTRLSAYIVCKATNVPETFYMHAFLRERLPEYMIPSSFHFLKEFPLLPNGKIDRHALTKRDKQKVLSDITPYSQVESKLRKIWVRILSCDHLGLHDSFFLLGGHSLLAIQLLGEIFKSFNVQLTLAEIQELPRLKEMAALIETKTKESKSKHKTKLEQLLRDIENMPDEEVVNALEIHKDN